MSPRDFARMVAVCFLWACNNIIGVILIGGMGVPPLFYAALRLGLVTLLLARLLWPLPPLLLRTAAAGLCLGAVHFGFLFLGFRTATPSAAAIVLQTAIPMAAILSVLWLGERPTIKRAVGIVLSLCGIVIVMWNPQQLAVSWGLLLVFIAAAALAVGSILVKTLPRMAPLRLQAWVNALSFPVLAIMSLALERDGVARMDVSLPLLAVCLVFSAVGVTIFAHTAYFRLLQTYDANIVVPLTLLMPLMTVAMGIALAGDRPTLQFTVGAALAIGGVLVIVLRRGRLRRVPGRLRI